MAPRLATSVDGKLDVYCDELIGIERVVPRHTVPASAPEGQVRGRASSQLYRMVLPSNGPIKDRKEGVVVLGKLARSTAACGGAVAAIDEDETEAHPPADRLGREHVDAQATVAAAGLDHAPVGLAQLVAGQRNEGVRPPRQ